MVAASNTSQTPSTPVAPIPATVLNGRGQLVRFTVRDVQKLLEQGVLPEDASTELLNGLIVKKDRADRGEDQEMIGKKHRLCVTLLAGLSKLIDNDSRHVQTQQPLVCANDHMPEPDFVIVRGVARDYTSRDVTAADVYCVIEVADSSYERDIGEKLVRYAQAAVPFYVVIYLSQRSAEVFTDPNPAAGTYAPPRVLSENDSLSLPIGASEHHVVMLKEVLP